MPTQTKLSVDREASALVHEVRRAMSASEQADLTLSETIRRLVAWWRNEPTPGRADQLDHRTEAMST